MDRIYVWQLDTASGRLAPSDKSSVTLPLGDGPRHFCFHPNGKSLYSIQEEASTITRFDYQAHSGELLPRQTVSTLPVGFAGSSFASTLSVARNGKFLYAGNRLYDSVSVFAIDAKDNLSLVQNAWTRGSYPSSFNLDPSGRFLYCCNQNSDNITSFHIDDKTGELSFTSKFVPVGNPMSIVFWETLQH